MSETTLTPTMSFEELMLQAGNTMPVQAAAPAVVPAVAPQLPPAPQAEPAFFMAKFGGFYYVPSGKNSEDKPFQIEVKIPTAWLKRNDYIPEGFFRAFLAPRLMKNNPEFPSYNGIKNAELLSTTGLPATTDDKTFLNWTSDLAVLEAFIIQRNLPVKADLYATPRELRRAIFRCIQCIKESNQGGGIDVFLKEQEKRTTGKNKVKREVEAELKAIGY